jgi:aspartate 1-decarboxylase
MLIQVHKSKIHRAKITQANLNYVGSITIDEDLIDAADLVAGERVQIVNNNNGERLETYVIKGERGSGIICLNGAAARKAEIGDVVIIISYGYMTQEEARAHKAIAIFPDENNKIEKA